MKYNDLFTPMYAFLFLILCLISNVACYCHCGRFVRRSSEAKSRIYNGKDVLEGRFPWQLFLIIEFFEFGKRSDYEYIAGAVLISKRHALTAAHNFFFGRGWMDKWDGKTQYL